MASVARKLCSAVIFFVLFLFVDELEGERHTIKIVDEPSNYGMMNSYQGHYQSHQQEPKLKMRITPSNFSGPVLLHRLVGKCFTKTDESYKYEVCPFINVTQHEETFRWNPYSGVLGVWQEWEIINNTFVAMVMREGDKCGNNQRTAKVYFTCGKENTVMNVTEPSTCNYHVNFSSPYVCHRQAMLVYPTLNKQLQTEWGLLEGQLANKEITRKGYNKYLRKIFEKAGYVLSKEIVQKLSTDAKENEKKPNTRTDGQFDNLYQCQEEYRKLKTEVEQLKTQLAAQKEEKHDVADIHEADPYETDKHED